MFHKLKIACKRLKEKMSKYCECTRWKFSEKFFKWISNVAKPLHENSRYLPKPIQNYAVHHGLEVFLGMNSHEKVVLTKSDCN